ncbi:MAG: cation diffusion facilitator family transporter [Lachnospiraceae bacterium]|nr:cation diffusion facilitator family transporter [Lachnospiraceae bacterium]
MEGNIERNHTQEDFEKTAMHVSFISIIVNIALSVFKLFAGVFAHSAAMVSDAVHSASDVFSTIVVMIGVKLSAQASDKKHPYGHERLECVAASILATVLALTGLGIGYSAVTQIIHQDYTSTVPGTLALIAALVSILAKEAMYHYTRYHAKRIDSGALMADAWHHRSDALSSVGALIGIAAARAGFPILDPIASLVICLFIEKAALDIYKDAMDKMVDEACDDDTEAAIRDCVLAQEGVLGVDMLQTRLFGNKIYVDLEIRADGSSSLTEAHEIAERVHSTIEATFPKVKHIMVHVNPA